MIKTPLGYLLLYYIFSPLFIFLITIASFIVWRSLRKCFRRTGRLYSRLEFSLRVVGTSQLVFLTGFVAFLILTFGIGAFTAPDLLFLNLIAAVGILLASPLMYPLAKKWTLRNSQMQQMTPSQSTPRGWTMYGFAFAGIFVPIILFTIFNGRGGLDQFLSELTSSTANTKFIKYQKYPHESLYLQVAQEKQDPSPCNDIHQDQHLRDSCFSIMCEQYPTKNEVCSEYIQ